MSDSIDQLRTIGTEYESISAKLDAAGQESVMTVRTEYNALLDLFDRYEERATDWDDFEGYVEFQNRLVEFIDGLPAGLPERDAFIAADEKLDQRNLSERDFERARAALTPARELAELADRHDELEREYRQAYHELERELSTLENRIDDLRRLQSYADLDLERSIDPLQSPIQEYNEAIRDSFRTFRETAPATELLDWVTATTAYPLVSVTQPPDRLTTYLETHPVGTEPIPTLLEYAEYSSSKLAHYVDDPQALLEAIGSSRTYLERLNSTPLTIDWPPPQADYVRYRIDELISVIDAFADAKTVAQLRSIAQLTRTATYAELRAIAVANDRLDPEARRRLRDGSTDRELATATDRRDQLEDVLSAHDRP
ncbi:DUF7118 family protein [Halocatena halophila]|uniref:DUF7118 family protein n=1 Tax=Halocatena halophila TaxID=2814576 RepID=UPI002ED05B69